MSAAVNSGSAQTVAANSLVTGAGLGATAASVLMLNAHYLFYGAALRPWLGSAGGARALPTLFLLGDGNWILSMRAHELGERDAAYVAGSGLAMYLAWLAGTACAAVFGQAIPRPESLGLDFLLAAFCAATAVVTMCARPAATTRHSALAALASALLVDRLAGPHWATVAAGIAAIAVAWFSAGRHESRP